MNEKNIIKIILALSIIGIFLLFFILENSNFDKLEGKIEKINFYDSSTTIYLENSTIEIVLFTNKLLNLKKGNIIQVEGKFDKYQNKTQLICDKIIK
jgi:hypothetical protein